MNIKAALRWLSRNDMGGRKADLVDACRMKHNVMLLITKDRSDPIVTMDGTRITTTRLHVFVNGERSIGTTLETFRG